MSDTAEKTVVKSGSMTKKSDKVGIDVLICAPNWFDEKIQYKIANAPERTASLEFSGTDLNFAARVLYAEASGSAQLSDKDKRDKEKLAILNVMHFRLNRRGYPTNSYIAQSFQEVGRAKQQFESVNPGTPKFASSDTPAFQSLSKKECLDLAEALEAIQTFLKNGPDNVNYLYDNFRGYNPTGRGEHIGRSRFWMSSTGKNLYEKAP